MYSGEKVFTIAFNTRDADFTTETDKFIFRNFRWEVPLEIKTDPSQEYNVVHKFLSETQAINTTGANYYTSILNLGIATNLHSSIGSTPLSATTINLAYPELAALKSEATNGLLVIYKAEPWSFCCRNPFQNRDVVFQHVSFASSGTTANTNIHGTHILTFTKISV